MPQHGTIRGRLTEPVRYVLRPSPQQAASAPERPGPRRWRIPAPVIVALLAAAVTIIVQGYRLSAAPEVFGDEGAYLQVARHIAGGAGLTNSSGPFFWHPPLFMLIEAAYIKIGGLGGMRPLPELFDVRWINVGFSGATAGLLALLGYRMRGWRLAVLVSLLFMLDPYVERINRRNMLETATIFFVVLAIYLMMTGQRRRPPWRWLGPGLAFGLAVLTKEPAAVFLLVPFAYALFGARNRIRDAVGTAATAAVVYLGYVLWAVSAGYGGLYLAWKWFEFRRVPDAILGVPPGPGPGGGTMGTRRTFYDSTELAYLAGQYVSSYLVIAASLAGTIILLTRFRADSNARLLAAWMAVSAVWGMALIVVSDQYSYYIIVPAILVVGYLADYAIGRYRGAAGRQVVAVISALFVACCLVFGGYRWVTDYAVGSANCYARVAAFVRAHVPAGQAIASTNELSSYFLDGRYDVLADKTASGVLAGHARVLILSSRDAATGNQGTTPAFYRWATRNSRLVYACWDFQFWKLGVYFRGGFAKSPSTQAARLGARRP